MITPAELEARIETLFDELVGQQEKKVTALASELCPSATRDDLLQPQDLPELARDPDFNYEDGLLAGLRAARMALRARLLGPLRS
jgi:hypothetical protein